MSFLEPLRPLETTWEDWLLGGGALASFDDPSLPLEVEIGPGDDDFLLESARAHADRNWLGIEYSRKRVRRQIRKIQRALDTPGHVRFIWRPAADLIGPFLSPARVRAYHIYFPDPWPKKHHHRYRMVHPPFIAGLGLSLEPAGAVHLCTDHQEYAEEIVGAFAADPAWENPLPGPGYRELAPGEIGTVFENRWRAAGRTCLRLEFRRRP